MPTFRPYSDDELRNAATAYDLDPAFVEAVYAVESSRGRDPRAMAARPVKRKRDSTIVRGPFQLEDDTTTDLVRKHGLGDVNVDDPDTHLELAMRLMADLKDQYNGDYRKMAQAYLGGPGGVANSKAKDELGTSTGTYGNRILREMEQIRSRGGGEPAESVPDLPLPAEPDANTDDIYGIPRTLPMLVNNDPDRVSWHDLMAANRSDTMGLPATMGGSPVESDLPEMEYPDYVKELVTRMANEEFDGKDFTNAVAG